MRTNILTLIFFLIYSISFSQKPDKKLFQLVERDSAKVTINITIPSLTNSDTINTPEFLVEMKYSIMVELHYVNNQKNLKSTQPDTIYIAAYNKEQWIGIDPKHAESLCYLKTEPCGILLAEPGIYLIRFRYRTKIKTYKLIVKM